MHDTTEKIIVRNILWVGFSYLVTKPLFFLFIIFAARRLGVSDFGKFSFALALVTILSIFLDLGFNELTTREVSKVKSLARKYLGNGLSFRIIVFLVLFLLTAGILTFMNYPPDTMRIIYISLGYLICSSLSGFVYSFFRGFEKMKYESLLTIIEKLLIISAGSSVLILNFGLEAFWLTHFSFLPWPFSP